MTSVGKYCLRMDDTTWHRKPIWMALQGFGWGENPENGPNGRAKVHPSLHEMRFMAFDAMLNACTGYGLWGTNFVKSVDFTETMYRYMDFQPIYTFRSLSRFESFCTSKKVMAYVEDQASYGSLVSSTLQEARKDSKKEFAILDYEYLTDTEKASFQQKYGTPASSLMDFSNEKGPTLISSGQEEIIRNYFN